MDGVTRVLGTEDRPVIPLILGALAVSLLAVLWCACKSGSDADELDGRDG